MGRALGQNLYTKFCFNGTASIFIVIEISSAKSGHFFPNWKIQCLISIEVTTNTSDELRFRWWSFCARFDLCVVWSNASRMSDRNERVNDFDQFLMKTSNQFRKHDGRIHTAECTTHHILRAMENVLMYGHTILHIQPKSMLIFCAWLVVFSISFSSS